MHKTGRALAQIHLAALLFGLTGILGELIRADALAITAGRSGFAVTALLLSLRWQARVAWRSSSPASIALLIGAGVLLTVHWITFFIAVKTGGVALATLGFASFPAFITLGELCVFRETVKRQEWISLVLVSIGLVLVTPSPDISNPATAGLLWGLFSGFSFALLALANRRLARDFSAYALAGLQNLGVFALTLPFAAAALVEMSIADWFWMAVLGLLCTAWSHYLLIASLRVLKARSAAIIIALEPVYAIAFAALLFAQYPGLRALAGGCLMVSAIVWSGLHRAEAQ